MTLPASPLQSLIKLLAPQPPVLHPEFDGLEYRWKIFAFRPALFTIEPYIILGVVLYLLAFFIGKTRNSKRANAWFDAHLPLLSQQFSRPTVAGLVPDGYSDFFSFSTGRRNIASLHVVFTLIPRHDLLQAAYQFIRSCAEITYNPKDVLELDFKLFPVPNAQTFVWAAVNKDYLPKIKDTRWDLTFTRTTENAQLGPGFVVMSEFADVTENLLKPSNQFGLPELLNNPAYKRYVRSLSITDQPSERPAGPVAGQRERHVILSLTVPPPSKADATVPLVEGIFKMIDKLDSKVVLRPETKTKLKKVREDLDEELKKEATAEKKEEAENDKAAAKRKAIEEKLSKLSAAEQKKVQDRERKRALRKTQGKVVRK